MFKFVENNGIEAKCKPEQWKAALSLIEQELRRALLHGFTKAEFSEATASLIKGVSLRAEQKETRKNSELSDAFVRVLGGEQVFTDPIDDQQRVAGDLAAITAEDCHAALKKSWNAPDVQVFVGGNLSSTMRRKPFSPPSGRARRWRSPRRSRRPRASFAYTELRRAGQDREREDVKDLEITEATFANGVRVNFKKTDLREDSVRILANFGGGRLEAPADKPGLIPYAQSVFALAGLEKHSVDELRPHLRQPRR